jgi:hypothetical protein
MNRTNEMVGQWARVEHYRLQCAQSWPDSPYKTAVIGSIRAALEDLGETSLPLERAVYAPRKKAQARVLMFPSSSIAAAAVPPLQAA